jgi:3-methyladenine DNA glycosylase AlkD
MEIKYFLKNEQKTKQKKFENLIGTFNWWDLRIDFLAVSCQKQLGNFKICKSKVRKFPAFILT